MNCENGCYEGCWKDWDCECGCHGEKDWDLENKIKRETGG